MNLNEYVKNQEIKNRRLLLRALQKQEKKIQEKLYQAMLKGNSTTYLNRLKNEIKTEINTLKVALKKYAEEQTLESYTNGKKVVEYQVRQMKLQEEATLTARFGAINTKAVEALTLANYEPLSKMSTLIGRQVDDFLSRKNFKNSESALKAIGQLIGNEKLRKIGLEGVEGVVIGSDTWTQAAKKIKNDILAEGVLKVPYYNKNGDVVKMVKADTYAKMVARTTTAQTMREAQKDSVKDIFGDDGDLVEILGNSSDPDSPCIPFEGKILSLNGDTDDKIIASLGGLYGGLLADAEAEGLFHPNCIHSMGVTAVIANAYGYN